MLDSKILVVEDDTNLLETLRYNLRKKDYEVVTASDGEQALEVARREKSGLIVLDIMLPKISGFEILEAAKILGIIERWIHYFIRCHPSII